MKGRIDQETQALQRDLRALRRELRSQQMPAQRHGYRGRPQNQGRIILQNHNLERSVESFSPVQVSLSKRFAITAAKIAVVFTVISFFEALSLLSFSFVATRFSPDLALFSCPQAAMSAVTYLSPFFIAAAIAGILSAGLAYKKSFDSHMWHYTGHDKAEIKEFLRAAFLKPFISYGTVLQDRAFSATDLTGFDQQLFTAHNRLTAAPA
jgi:hypothetical protein